MHNSTAWSKAATVARWVSIALIMIITIAGSAWAISTQVRVNTQRICTLEKQQDKIYEKVDELWRTLLKKGTKE